MKLFNIGRVFLLSSSLALLACAPPATAEEGHPHGDAQHAMPMTGDQDHDFATMMRKHHGDAVTMSEKELKDGSDPEMKAMAQSIITAQKKEIEEIDKWLANHKPKAGHEKK